MTDAPRQIGRYTLHEALATGGMATVHLGKLNGPDGFSRTVAIKRLHEQFAAETEFVAMLLDEARLVTRIRHPNVVQILDVIREGTDVLLVMEYVHGESLSRLLKLSKPFGPIPLPIISGIMIGALQGLHAAHEARSEDGELLELVHRDVSPQNIMVGLDGTPRVLDFGIAKATGRIQTTDDGVLKGKIAYMAPEQFRSQPTDRRVDIWAAGVVLWELVAGRRLFEAEVQLAVLPMVLEDSIPRLAIARPSDTLAIQKVLDRALTRTVAERFATADEMAMALEREIPPATTRAIADWAASLSGPTLNRRSSAIRAMESLKSMPPPVEASASHKRAVLGVPQGVPPEPPTQTTSSISTTDSGSPGPARPPAPRNLSPLFGAIAALSLAIALFVYFRDSGTGAIRSDPRGSSDRVRFAESNGAAPAQPVAPSASVGAEKSLTTSVRTNAPLPNGPHTTTPATARPTATAVTPSCNPPYTLGPAPDFIRRPKPECM